MPPYCDSVMLPTISQPFSSKPDPAFWALALRLTLGGWRSTAIQSFPLLSTVRAGSIKEALSVLLLAPLDQ